MSSEIILFLTGFFISILSVCTGGSMPFYLLLMSWFFPSLTTGNLLGAHKAVGFIRNFGVLPATWSVIDWGFIKSKAPLLIIGAFGGGMLISEVSKIWIPYLLILAFFLAEFGVRLFGVLTKKFRALFEVLVGIYVGVLGASSKSIILSVYRLEVPQDDQIAHLKIQIQTLMLFTAAGASIAHLLHGTLLLWVIIPMGLGNFLGGYVGGILLKKMGKLNGRVQRWVMRVSFVLGIVGSFWLA